MIYKRSILSLVLYGALLCTTQQNKLIRAQILINIKIAKAFRTTSNKALHSYGNYTDNLKDRRNSSAV